MAKHMLIDATHPEETRVVVVSGEKVEEFDYESANKTQLKGNIYLAKVTRVEPSLQAAFVEYGGNRHGFLPFSEIHPDYYRIPVADREALLAEEARLRSEIAGQDEDEEEIPESAVDRAADQEVPEEPEDDSNGNGADEDADNAAAVEAAQDDAAENDVAENEAGENDAGGDEAGGLDTADIDSEKAGREDAEARTPAGEAAESAEPNGDGPIEEVAAETSVDTLSGDEVEDTARRRAQLLRRYKIQEVIKRRQVMLVQVTKEERGTKGAALTTYLSLAGRYCVLMPNTAKGGGISRKISNASDRRRLKSVVSDLEIPDGMAVIVRTAGSQRTKAEIRRDYEYLLRLWDEIRTRTLESTAPSLIHEEANLIKRAIRDLYSREMDDVLVEGEEGYKAAKSFMRMLMPSHAKKVKQYSDDKVPLFQRHRVERQMEAMHNPSVRLKSGGSIVINPTEALVAIDVNSGKATRERHIEETALKTNLEAADEVARQLRLRDLAGLIVIDFIDMEESRHNRDVERRLKEAMKNDRARIQLGRISPFGLLELSRQRLRPSLIESATVPCAICQGTGVMRSAESASLLVLRALTDDAIASGGGDVEVRVPTAIALYLLNEKRQSVNDLEQRFGLSVMIRADDSLTASAYELQRLSSDGVPIVRTAEEAREEAEGEREEDDRRRRRGRRGGRRRKRDDEAPAETPEVAAEADADAGDAEMAAADTGAESDEEEEPTKRRRRGKRGGRRRSRRREPETTEVAAEGEGEAEVEATAETGSAPEEAPAEQTEGGAADSGEAKPRRRRRPRGRKASEGNGEAALAPEASDAAAVGTSADSAAIDDTMSEPATAAEAAPAAPEQAAPEQAAPEQAAKPRRRRRTSEPAAAEVVEAAAEEPPADAPEVAEQPDETPIAEVAPPVPIAPGVGDGAQTPLAADGGNGAAAEPSEAGAEEAKPTASAEELTAPTVEAEASAARPRRRGWWNRLLD